MAEIIILTSVVTKEDNNLSFWVIDFSQWLLIWILKVKLFNHWLIFWTHYGIVGVSIKKPLEINPIYLPFHKVQLFKNLI